MKDEKKMDEKRSKKWMNKEWVKKIVKNGLTSKVTFISYNNHSCDFKNRFNNFSGTWNVSLAISKVTPVLLWCLQMLHLKLKLTLVISRIILMSSNDVTVTSDRHFNDFKCHCSSLECYFVSSKVTCKIANVALVTSFVTVMPSKS